MKKSGQLATLAGLLFWIPAGAGAQEFVGEFCWERQTGAVIRLAVTHIAGDHFLLNGQANTSGAGELTPLVGTAEATSDRVFLVMHFTGEDDVRIWMGTARGILDRRTLLGTIEILEVFHLKSGPDPLSAQVIHLPKESLTPVACDAAPEKRPGR